MIKFDLINHYQFSFYAVKTEVEPSPQVISEFMEAFNDTGFMPTVVPFYRLTGKTAENRQMLTLITKNQDWTIEFEPNRFSFVNRYIPILETVNPGKFIDSVFDFCSRILAIIPTKGNRLAFTTKGLLAETPTEKMVELHSKLINRPKFYEDNHPVEWTTRNVSRYKSKKVGKPRELYNVITDINRVHGRLKDEKGNVSELDRIEIGYDINTYQNNVDTRFGVKDIKPFLSEAFELSEKISTDIEEVLK